MSGLKVAGCCVHVATLIYYLSYGMHVDEIKLPGKHLNSIFVDFGEKDQSNKPRYVRGTRIRRESTSGSDDTDAINESDLESDQDPTKENSIFFHEDLEVIDQIKLQSNVEINTNQDSKRHSYTKLQSHDNTIEQLTAHIPLLGGTIDYNGESNVTISNTYLIDYFLFALWYLSNHIENFQVNIPELEQTQTLIDIIKNINNYNWNKAKELWIVKSMKIKEKAIKKN